jgi:diguanylate cyclase (GGDEF)-like protein
VAVTTTTLDGIDRARHGVSAERRRATRCAEIAARHEKLAKTGPAVLRQFHVNAAVAHRQLQTRHLVSAGIHASHLARLRASVREVMLAPPSHEALPRLRDGPTLVSGEPENLHDRRTHDPLTNLPNRRLFAERLAIAIERDDPEQPDNLDRRLAVCLINLDNFRGINDRLGREIGDRLLVALARRLTERLPGRFLARLGGDEFVVLLENMAGWDEAAALADTVLTATGEPITVNGHQVSISASIGVAQRPAAQADAAEMLRDADISLGWAKSEGRGRWVAFDSDRYDQATARSALAADLPTAIERGEIRLEYQPIISLTDGHMAGVEALARWRHPELGLLLPDRFIDLAEVSGMTVRLGQAVLAQACAEAARWRAVTSNPPFVSVNVTPRQLHDSDMVREVATVLDETGLPASHLRLEILEGAIVRPNGRSVSTLHRLVDLGVSIAIDDFGTGYSSLSYLRRLPVKMIKIDRSFVVDLCPPDGEPDETGTEVLAAIISLAHVLGLTVTAEGVETTAQAEWLQSIGTDSAQGWYFGRPTGPEEIETAIAAGA